MIYDDFVHEILLNNTPIKAEDIEYPCLIHGKQGSGASQFTISLAVQLVLSGNKTIFFSVFPKGRENLLGQLGESYRRDAVVIPESGNEKEFLGILDGLAGKPVYIVVKNIEEYGEETLKRVLETKNLVLSGDLDSCVYTDQLISKSRTQILFQSSKKLELKQKLPLLQKYEGFLASSSLSGRVRLDFK